MVFNESLLNAWSSQLDFCVCCAQIMWTSTVFKDPVPVILDMLTNALLTLDPSLSTCFANHLQQNSEILATLVQLKQVWFLFSLFKKNILQKWICYRFVLASIGCELFSYVCSGFSLVGSCQLWDCNCLHRVFKQTVWITVIVSLLAAIQLSLVLSLSHF